MKILLIRYHDKKNINTREVKDVILHMGIWPPLGLLYLSTMLRKNGYEVEILDVIKRGMDSDGAKEAIHASGADLIGITATTPEIRGVIEAASFAKETGAKVVVGGPHIGIFPHETLSFPEVDFAVHGDGEIPLLRLVQTLGSKNPDFSTVPGLVYKENGEIHKNNVYVEKDLDNMPFPDWSLLDIDSYSRADAQKPLATMVSIRGCPYNCGFCFRSDEQKIVRIRSPKNVVSEIEFLVKKHKVKEIIFVNDELTMNREQISEICSEIIRKNIKVSWQGAARVNSVDRKLLELMKKAGCKQLKYGIESGDQGILNLMRKGITISQVKEAIDITKKTGIKTGAYFIIGYIGENENTIRKTIDFSKNLNLDFVMFYPAVPLPKTHFQEMAVKDGLIDPEYWREYSLNLRQDELPFMVKDTDKWVRTAFREFYMRPRYFYRKIKDIQAWKALISNPGLIRGLFLAKVKDIKAVDKLTTGHNDIVVKKVNEMYYDIEVNNYESEHPEIIEGEKEWWDEIGRKYIKPISLASGRIVVFDIGTGTGFVPKIVSRYLKKEDMLKACDISSEMVKKINKEKWFDNFDCFVCNAEKIPLEKGSIDIVTINSVIHHFSNYNLLLSEVNRILKSNGLIIIAHEPNKKFFDSFMIRFLAKIFKRLGCGMKLSKNACQIINQNLRKEGIIKEDLSEKELLEMLEYNSPAEHRVFNKCGFDADIILNNPVFRGYQLLESRTKSTFAYHSKMPFFGYIQDKIIYKIAGNQGSLFSIVLKKG